MAGCVRNAQNFKQESPITNFTSRGDQFNLTVEPSIYHVLHDLDGVGRMDL